MTSWSKRLLRIVPAATVVVAATTTFVIARLPTASEATRAAVAKRYHFTEMAIALPPGLPDRTVRAVNPDYERYRAWISSVGAGIALNDLDGDGLPNDLCLVDTRSDAVVVTPAPGANAPRYAPFTLDVAPLPTGPAVAPMGCAPGDFNGDGRMDLLVYYWGRTPVLFMGAPITAGGLNATSYRPTELVPTAPAPDGEYHGPLWNTNAVSIADFDGDGHPDIAVLNYFPDSQVLDPNGQPNVVMNHSMSRATNGGGAHVMRWVSSSGGDRPSAQYIEDPKAINAADATGWTLAAGSADLDGDLLPELYLANDFGQDRMFHNVSTPGHIRFGLLAGQRHFDTPKSMVLGNDSFKGMSIDFGDLDHNGRFDMFVSNITTRWGLQESNFVWMNKAATPAEAATAMAGGTAPFDNRAAQLNLAWTGWGWDAKMADFDNSGNDAIVQATGFIKGKIDRWPWLQELAMSNDLMLANPAMWPDAGTDDDIAGFQSLAFWARESNGRYINISGQLGLAVPTPTRGIAVADADGDGWQDFAVARQWGPPVFYHNDHPNTGTYVGLRLYRPATPGGTAGAPAYGAVVRLTTADGRDQIAQLDGGGGHSGKRSFDVFFGLGAAADAHASAQLEWRDAVGGVHRQTLALSGGWHTIMLDQDAREVTGS